MKITFQSVDIENVVKGKSRYSKATVQYTYNGEPRKQSVMSFSNPTVFKQIQELQPGQEIDVQLTKNDAGYSEWASISTGAAPAATQAPNAASAATKVVGSNYETRDERAQRQVFIIKQSSLANAITVLTTGAKAPPAAEEILALAERFVDWVVAPASDPSED